MSILKIKFTIYKSYIFIVLLILSWFIDTIAHTQFKYNESNEKLGNDISFIMISGMLLYTLGNYEVFFNKKIYWIEFFCIVWLSMFIFEKLGDLPWLRNNLSTSSDWNVYAKIVYSITLICIFFILLKFAYDSYLNNQLNIFLQGIFIPSIIIVISFSYKAINSDTNYIVHIHHWWLAYCLAFFARFPSRFNRYFAAIFTGIYLEGLVVSKNSFIIENIKV